MTTTMQTVEKARQEVAKYRETCRSTQFVQLTLTPEQQAEFLQQLKKDNSHIVLMPAPAEFHEPSAAEVIDEARKLVRSAFLSDFEEFRPLADALERYDAVLAGTQETAGSNDNSST